MKRTLLAVGIAVLVSMMLIPQFTGSGRDSDVMAAETVGTVRLIIHATFDSSITSDPNAAAIEAMINRVIAIYESLYSDPITIEILFRYSTTGPDGTPLPANRISLSQSVHYTVPWNTYVRALSADAKTSNDILAMASLGGTALSTNVNLSSANGRAVGLNAPPAMFVNGTVGDGGPFDGIVTLDSSVPWQFTRPVSAGNFDAQRATEHEIDEVMGLGSSLSQGGSDLRPQDLFSWSSPGVRNLTLSGTRYFSINEGITDIVNFNQGPTGDFGDWLGEACPQPHPYVQNAFGCTGQSSDVTATSPEGIALDVIGYDLVGAPPVGGGVPVRGGATATGGESIFGAGGASHPTIESSVGTGSANYRTINDAQSAPPTPTAAHLETTYVPLGQGSQIINLGRATNTAQIVGHWKDGLYIVEGVWVKDAFKTCGTEKYPCILIPHPPLQPTPTPGVLTMEKKTERAR